MRNGNGSKFTVGSLVRVRGREWVVLPSSTDELVRLRPLGGTDDEQTAVLTALEPLEPAIFALPDPNQVGDYRSARLLRAAVLLGFRSSAGPFRSFAKINLDPRPYQLVPLLMALKLDPVRLLIADDVGIGKTIEALLIVRELLDRGEIDRLAVLCPPQLAQQWQAELRQKFFLEAELVLPSTATRLERHLPFGESLFQRHPFVVVSTDFIKSDRRRDDFLRTAPECIIVDEAHTVVHALSGRGQKHQRYELVAALAAQPTRHLLLVTATPHSGKDAAFRALLTLLKPDFADLPEDLTGPDKTNLRRTVARYFVQRRRGDIKAYGQGVLDTLPPFPERDVAEETYKLTEAYKRFSERVLRYARELVRQPDDGPTCDTNGVGYARYRQRVRWWSALALLRALASSPAAAAATLRSRSATTAGTTEGEVDEIGRRMVLDLMQDETQSLATEALDVIPGSDISDLADGVTPETEAKQTRRRLQEMARTADALHGAEDNKLQKLTAILKHLLGEGHQPIIFCRFIPTVDYLTEALRKSHKAVAIAGVTGLLPPAEREARVAQLLSSPQRILVCTDCLSEGINLQAGFDAVIHYDLSWNPTRHEQRCGRVDRYGQPSARVKVVTYYGLDNQIDGLVLEVLLRKHQAIQTSLGISVPLPSNTEEVVEAIMEGLLLRESATEATDRPNQAILPGFAEHLTPRRVELDLQWQKVAAREKRSRTMFAQEGIRVEEVAAELQAARAAVGSGVDVAAFMKEAVQLYRGTVSENEAVTFDLRETPRALRDLLSQAYGTERGDTTAVGKFDITQFTARFELPVPADQLYLPRTHPLVESLAAYVFNTALDNIPHKYSGGEADEARERTLAGRAGAMRTQAVGRRTTLLLVRFRYHLISKMPDRERQLLAEDSLSLAFAGSPENATWLDTAAAEALLQAEPDENIHPQQAAKFVGRVLDDFTAHLAPKLNEIAHTRGEELLAAHLRVREAAYQRGERRVQHRVVPRLPPDVLGIYVFLPAPKKI